MNHYIVRFTFADTSEVAWEGDADTEDDAKAAAIHNFRRRLRNLTETTTDPPGEGEYLCEVVPQSAAG
jgi:hypothetical protein